MNNSKDTNKHTPGTWTLQKCPMKSAETDPKDWPWLVWYNDEEYEGVLAIVQTKEAQANAYLIAAAPEMYKVLKEYEEWEGNIFMNVDPSNETPRPNKAQWEWFLKIQEKRNKALEKARGE